MLTPPPRRRFRRPAVSLVAALIALGLPACAGSPTYTRPSNAPLQSILQQDALLQADPAGVLPVLRQLGVQVVRVNVFWSHIAPAPTSQLAPRFDATDPAAYPPAGWAPYDAIVRDAAATGVRVLFTLTGPPPLWAAGSGMPSTRNCPCAQWEPSAAAFGAFVKAVGRRYSGRYVPAGEVSPLPQVRFWSVWNEPNYGPDLAPQAIDGSTVEVSPRLYRGLVDAAWSALRASGHAPPRDRVLIGETAPRGLTGPNLPGNFSGMVPLRFIRALYCVNGGFHPLRGTAATARGCPATAAGSRRFAAENPALFQASGWADHPYPDALAPNIPTPPPIGGGYADFAALGNLEHTLDRAAAAYGERPRLPIYSTEFGYRTDPPFAGGIPLRQAAGYLNQAEYLSWRNPRVRSYDQYLLIDPPLGPHSDFVTGLEFASGAPKPYVFDAFRMPLWLPVTRTRSGRSLTVWGCVRPASEARRRTGRIQRVAIQFAPRHGAFRTLDRVTLRRQDGCYFETRVTFPRSGTVRLAWSGSGPTLHSREQAIRVS